MSNKAWMTTCLFLAWIDHFILALKNNSKCCFTLFSSAPHHGWAQLPCNN
jgi:hypothetical protein